MQGFVMFHLVLSASIYTIDLVTLKIQTPTPHHFTTPSKPVSQVLLHTPPAKNHALHHILCAPVVLLLCSNLKCSAVKGGK